MSMLPLGRERNTELLLELARKLESLPAVASGDADRPRANVPEGSDVDQHPLYAWGGVVELGRNLADNGAGPERLNMDLDLSADGRVGGLAAFAAALRPDDLPALRPLEARDFLLSTVAQKLLRVDHRTAEALLHGPNYVGTARRWIEPAEAAQACRRAADGAAPEDLWPTLDRAALSAKCLTETPAMYHADAIDDAMDRWSDRWASANTIPSATSYEPPDVGESGDAKSLARQELVEAYADCARPNAIAVDCEIAPTATVEPFASLGPGSVIADGACVGSGAYVRAGTLVGADARIAGGSVVAEFCRLGPGSRVDGELGVGVRVGERAVVKAPNDANFARVGDEAVIGAGSTVTCSRALPVDARQEVPAGVLCDTKDALRPVGSAADGSVEASIGNVHFTARVGPGCTIAPSATVGANVWMDANVKVLDGANVESGARLGRGSTVGVGATVGENARLGHGVELQCGAVVGKAAEVVSDVSIGPRAQVADGCFVTASGAGQRPRPCGCYRRWRHLSGVLAGR